MTLFWCYFYILHIKKKNPRERKKQHFTIASLFYGKNFTISSLLQVAPIWKIQGEERQKVGTLVFRHYFKFRTLKKKGENFTILALLQDLNPEKKQNWQKFSLLWV